MLIVKSKRIFIFIHAINIWITVSFVKNSPHLRISLELEDATTHRSSPLRGEGRRIRILISAGKAESCLASLQRMARRLAATKIATKCFEILDAIKETR